MSQLESRRLKRKEADAEHLLLAMLKDSKTVLAQRLNELGITYGLVYNTLISMSYNEEKKEEEDAVSHVRRESDAASAVDETEEILDGYTDEDGRRCFHCNWFWYSSYFFGWFHRNLYSIGYC